MHARDRSLVALSSQTVASESAFRLHMRMSACAMALPIETPSRIWRRIEEGEARTGDMPSLPSLPAFDNSGSVDDEHTISLSLNQSYPDFPVMQASVERSMSQPLRSSVTSRFVDKEATVKSLISNTHLTTSAHGDPVRVSDGKVEMSRSHGNDEKSDDQEQLSMVKLSSSSVGTLFRSRIISCEDEDGLLTEALAPVSRTPSPLPFPNASFDIEQPTPRVSDISSDIGSSTAKVGHQPAEAEEVNNLATPLPRKKSFLLSVVKTRPRLSFPRPRLAHPLSQAHTFQPTTPLNDYSPENEVDSTPSGNASFISTASSHDLTVHRRANASFDPVTGPQGVGRFNSGKLNTYLHGLNRRLQEENELLVDKVKYQQLEIEALQDGLRRRELSGVMEDEGAEQWVFEKEEMEKQMHGFQESLETKERELADEQKERIRDKDRWRKRMIEVEEGVEDIVRDLEKRVVDAEMKTRSLNGIETLLKDTQLELNNVKADCQLLKGHVVDAETKVGSLNGIETLLKDTQLQLSDAKAECQLLKQRADQAERIMVNERELGVELTKANEEKDKLEKALQSSTHRLQESDEKAFVSSQALDRARVMVRQLENALEESDRKISSDSEEVAGLRAKLASWEQERLLSMSRSQDGPEFGTEALEAELSMANKEIGRLTALLNQSPARKAIEKAKDARIEILEKENEELSDQLRLTLNLPVSFTPRRNTSMNGMSPMHRHLINMSMKAPRTPGEPLRDASWLMNVTGDVSTAHLWTEIGRLQKELDFANESVDDKLDKLEEAGLGIVGLTKALENAQSRIANLEGQLNLLEAGESQCLDKTIYHKLDVQTKEIGDLHAAVSSQTKKCMEMEHTQSEGPNIRDVAWKLEMEIKCVQQEAEFYGRDLQQLRSEKDRMDMHYRQELEQHERANKETRTQLRLLKEQLADTEGVEGLKIKHKNECKGLFVQIRYLKAKFTRESYLRDDLGYQKHYLLLLLSRFEKSEKRILATIAQTQAGCPANSVLRSKLLKTTVLAIIFVLRTKRASNLWREQRSAKAAVAEALENVRENRLLKP
ncbi:hypothetical protein EW145_g3460 [Phellinidium pouzarii]|uniref:Pericentrin/AKAP-450 centrosomal targeting domain-containing protein n=1 Tax=Phellinidium pouzarii TaxID=167371 RepID=A0A4S4LCC3_9AGAM|nr:hypothetical protein EW145_g3460 [Phellinidium pouzarii]